MFALWTLLAGFVSVKAATSTRKVKRASLAADEAIDVCTGMGEKVTTEKVLAEMDAKAKTDAYFDAQAKADKWAARKDKTLHPRNRYLTYAAGKFDAAVATYLAYPYIPLAVDTVKGWFAV